MALRLVQNLARGFRPPQALAAGAGSLLSSSATSSSRLRPQEAPQQFQARRGYIHWGRLTPHELALPMSTMPHDIRALMKKDPKEMDYYENYWYWRIRGESVVNNPAELPKLSYNQLARDLGLAQATEMAEHMVGMLELYEYLQYAPFIGPFGTIENPVLCPSVHNERIVGCTGGSGDNEHVVLWFRCFEGFLYRCGECDQIFMLVRINYELPDGADPFPVPPDVKDTFDWELLESAHKLWNEGSQGEYHYWIVGMYSKYNIIGTSEALRRGQITTKEIEDMIKTNKPIDMSKIPQLEEH